MIERVRVLVSAARKRTAVILRNNSATRSYRSSSTTTVSAFSRRRPAYEELLTAVEQGRFDAVLAWHTDRLHRSPRELERFIDAVEALGTDVQTVKAGMIDLRTPAGRMVARQLGAVARYESEHKSERIRRKHEQLAAEGRPHGGTRRYGWDKTHRVIIESEAGVVRNIIDRVIAGDSTRSIAQSLNRQGVLAATGKTWSPTTVRTVALRAANAGLREHRGRIVGPGVWPELVGRDRWEAVRAILLDPARRTPGTNARRYLLSGLARCGVCDSPLRAAQHHGAPAYRCEQRFCVGRKAEHVDQLVVGVVLARLRQPDAATTFGTSTPPDAVRLATEAQTLRLRLEQLALDLAEDRLTSEQFFILTERLRTRLSAVEAQQLTGAKNDALVGLAGAADVEDRWAALSLERQRAIVDLLLTVRVGRSRRGKVFDPESVELQWRSA